MLNLSTFGFFLYLVYPILLIGISIHISFTRETTLKSFFTADKNVSWFMLVLSLTASSLLGPYLLGLLNSFSVWGLSFYYGLTSVLMLIVLGRVIAPIFLKENIISLPDYLSKRFNKQCGLYAASLYLFMNALIKLLLLLFAVDFLISSLTGFDSYLLIFFFILVTGLSLIIGGLKTEIFSGVIQSLIFFLFITGTIIWSFQNSGSEQITKLPLVTAGISNEISEFLSRPDMLIGIPIIAFWFWCCDQFVIQKILSIRNSNEVKKTSLFASIFQLVPFVLIIIPAVVTNIFFPGSSVEQVISAGFLPVNFKVGLVIVITAAFTASIAGIFNSTTFTVTFDIYKKIKPAASERELILAGRMTIILMIFFSLFLTSVLQYIDLILCIKVTGLFVYLVTLLGTVFIAGVILRKLNSSAVLFTLYIATLLIVIKFIIEIYLPGSGNGLTMPGFFMQTGFFESAVFLFLFILILLSAGHFIIKYKNGFYKICKRTGLIFLRAGKKPVDYKTVLFCLVSCFCLFELYDFL